MRSFRGKRFDVVSSSREDGRSPRARRLALWEALVRALSGWLAPSLLLWSILEWPSRAILRGSAAEPVNGAALAASFVLVASIHCVIAAWLRGRVHLVASVVLLLVVSGVSLVNCVKILFRDEPLFPWDLFATNSWRQVLVLLPSIVPTAWTITLAGVVGFVTIVIAYVLVLHPRTHTASYRRPALTWSVRVTALALLVIVIRLAWAGELRARSLQYLKITHQVWNQKQSYLENGFLVSTLLNLSSVFIRVPKQYSQELIERDVVSLVPPIGPSSDGAIAQRMPNVIIYMMEAFWDATRLPVDLGVDPTPNFRRLAREGVSGDLISPVFGGGTANAELEILTGMSAAYFPSGSIPYQQHIHRPIPVALPAFLRAAGYKTVAVHPYHRWFWNRDNVYPRLGFDLFKGIEDLPAAPQVGPFASDSVLVDELTGLLDSPEPFFAFALTMSTHGGYGYQLDVPEPYNSITSRLADQVSGRELAIYAYLASLADKELGRLIELVTQSKRETVVVIFGDHLPALRGRVVYQQLGYFPSAPIRTWTHQEFQAMHAIPTVVWANFPLRAERIPTMGMNFFTSWLLETASLPMSPYFRLNRKIGEMLVYHAGPNKWVPSTAVGPGTSPANSNDGMSTIADLRTIIRAYYALHYDILFGKGYGLPYLQGLSVTTGDLAPHVAVISAESGAADESDEVVSEINPSGLD